MKTVEGFKLRTIGTDHVLTPEGKNLVNYNRMIALNQSAAFLWEKVEGMEFDEQTLADLLVEEYGIGRELALGDSRTLLASWVEAGIVTA